MWWVLGRGDGWGKGIEAALHDTLTVPVYLHNIIGTEVARATAKDLRTSIEGHVPHVVGGVNAHDLLNLVERSRFSERSCSSPVNT